MSPVIGGLVQAADASSARAARACRAGVSAPLERPYTRRGAAARQRDQSNRLGDRGCRGRRAAAAQARAGAAAADADRRLRRPARAVRRDAPLAHARRRRLRAADVGLSGRLQVAARRPRRAGAADALRATRSSPTACSGWASCRRVRLQRALARVGPDGAAVARPRPRARVGALGLVHGPARHRRLHRCCATPRASRARR